MASPRRKISQAERKERDALERVRNFILVIVIRRLFDEGWTTEQVALAYGQIQKETGHIVTTQAVRGWHHVDETHIVPNFQYVDETKVADEVYAAVKASQ
jgi:hypothetical protein